MNRKTIEEYARKPIRLLGRRVNYEHEAVFKLLDGVAFDIVRFGPSGQIHELHEIIPTRPASVPAEFEKFVYGSDDLVYCQNIRCDPGESAPEDWRHPSAKQRAEVDYSANPISIVIRWSDGTSFSTPPVVAYRNVVFACSNYCSLKLLMFPKRRISKPWTEAAKSGVLAMEGLSSPLGDR